MSRVRHVTQSALVPSAPSSLRAEHVADTLRLVAEARAIEGRLRDLRARLAEIEAHTQLAGHRAAGSWN